MSDEANPDEKGGADIMFTPAVRDVQDRLGSRQKMEKLASHGRFRTKITDDLVEFISVRNSIYLGTASADGQPYIQHRGGEPGFVKVVDENHLEFPDLPGNQQYISLGNLSENNRAFIFAMNYEDRVRVKLWGNLSVVEQEGPTRRFRFRVTAWDVNCPRNIPNLYAMPAVTRRVEELQSRIRLLEAEIERLKSAAE
ncbi:pyridoxamine 5'-phosphate oxidase family protein [Hoeflea sp. TYP-13]|uniref:pyridoxamine 5'-phosphate oxidase family protein n=1 Tax=Hoeflea sp. TYP-13 TaxID=3230023 RepID=UPI0034C630B9